MRTQATVPSRLRRNKGLVAQVLSIDLRSYWRSISHSRCVTEDFCIEESSSRLSQVPQSLLHCRLTFRRNPFYKQSSEKVLSFQHMNWIFSSKTSSRPQQTSVSFIKQTSLRSSKSSTPSSPSQLRLPNHHSKCNSRRPF